MPPSNIYDVNQPPDTQQAKLLGSDLRNLALNVQQRMALISGPLANRWNPATDAQPTNWTGVLYFATDTRQVFQWTGTAWLEITSFFGVPVARLDLAGQNAPIGTALLYAVTVSGIYRISSHILITTNGSSGSIGATIGWNNGLAAWTLGLSNVNVNLAGNEVSEFSRTFFAAAGTSITFATQFTGVVGGAIYTLRLRLESLG